MEKSKKVGMTGERALQVVKKLVDLAHEYQEDGDAWMDEGFTFASDICDEVGRPLEEE